MTLTLSTLVHGPVFCVLRTWWPCRDQTLRSRRAKWISCKFEHFQSKINYGYDIMPNVVMDIDFGPYCFSRPLVHFQCHRFQGNAKWDPIVVFVRVAPFLGRLWNYAQTIEEYRTDVLMFCSVLHTTSRLRGLNDWLNIFISSFLTST